MCLGMRTKWVAMGVERVYKILEFCLVFVAFRVNEKMKNIVQMMGVEGQGGFKQFLDQSRHSSVKCSYLLL